MTHFNGILWKKTEIFWLTSHAGLVTAANCAYGIEVRWFIIKQMYLHWYIDVQQKLMISAVFFKRHFTYLQMTSTSSLFSFDEFKHKFGKTIWLTLFLTHLLIFPFFQINLQMTRNELFNVLLSFGERIEFLLLIQRYHQTECILRKNIQYDSMTASKVSTNVFVAEMSDGFLMRGIF